MSKFLYPIKNLEIMPWIKYWLIKKSAGSILPKEYQQVDYIESSGTQYIDTGVKVKASLNIESNFKIISKYNADGFMLFGARTAPGLCYFYVGAGWNWSYSGIGYGDGLYKLNNEFKLNIDYKVKTDGSNVYINNELLEVILTEGNPRTIHNRRN